MSVYVAVKGQTFLDVCMITYGSLDYLVKLARDNSIGDLDSTDVSGISFSYDAATVVNQVIHQQLNRNYGTGNGIVDDEDDTVTGVLVYQDRITALVNEDRTKYLV